MRILILILSAVAIGLCIAIGIALMPDSELQQFNHEASDRFTERYGKPERAAELLVLVDKGYRIIDRGVAYSTLSWRIEVDNRSDYTLQCFVDTKFIDADGYVVDTDGAIEYVRPGKHELRSTTTVGNEVVGDIVAIEGDISYRRVN